MLLRWVDGSLLTSTYADVSHHWYGVGLLVLFQTIRPPFVIHLDGKPVDFLQRLTKKGAQLRCGGSDDLPESKRPVSDCLFLEARVGLDRVGEIGDLEQRFVQGSFFLPMLGKFIFIPLELLTRAPENLRNLSQKRVCRLTVVPKQCPLRAENRKIRR